MLVTAAATIQYQALTGPVVVPAAAAGPDLAAPCYPAQIARQATRPRPETVAPLYVPDVTQVAPARSWAPVYPDRLDPAKGTRARYQVAFVWGTTTPAAASVPTFAPAVAPDRLLRPYPRALYVSAQPMFGVETDVPVEAWAAIYPDRLAKLTLRPSSQSVLVADLTPVVVPTQPLATYPDRLARRSGHASGQSAVVADLTTPSVGVPTQPLTSYPVRVVRPRLPAAAAPAWVGQAYVPDVTQPVTALSWNGTQPDLVPASLRLHAARQMAVAFDRFDPPDVIVTPVEPSFTQSLLVPERQRLRVPIRRRLVVPAPVD